MNASDRFKPVRKVAANREASAARQFGKSQQQHREEADKLENLRQYHAEYLARFQESASNGMNASQLREYQAFMSKLEQAIADQEQIVRQSQQNCTEHKARWTEKHIRTKVVDKAIDRMEKTEQKARDAQEQKISDELAQRLGRPPH